MKNEDTILKRLNNATPTELTEICKILKLEEDDKDNISKICNEYRLAAGHSIANIFRQEDLPYKQILIDVADKLHHGPGWTHFTMDDHYSEKDIEDKIWEDIKRRTQKLKEKWDELSLDDQKSKEEELKDKLKKEGYSQAAISSFLSLLASGAGGMAIASPAALSIFYSSFFASIAAGIFGMSTAALIAAGILVGSIVFFPLGIIALGTPAYRKTIPLTIYMMKIDKRLEAEKNI